MCQFPVEPLCSVWIGQWIWTILIIAFVCKNGEYHLREMALENGPKRQLTKTHESLTSLFFHILLGFLEEYTYIWPGL